MSLKFILKLLVGEEKQHCHEVCIELINRTEYDPDLLNESWVYGYDPEIKVQSLKWKSPSSPQWKKKMRQSQSNSKTLLLFFYCYAILHHKYVPRGQTVNKGYYKSVLGWSCEKVSKIRTGLNIITHQLMYIHNHWISGRNPNSCASPPPLI